MKNTNKMVLVLMALLCLVLVGCPQPEQPETWTEISSFAGLDGTWVTTFDSGDDGEDLAKDFSSIATVYSANAFMTIKGDKIQQYNSISIDMTPALESSLEQAPGATTDDLWKGMKDYWTTASKNYEGYEFSFSSGRPYLIIITEKPYEISEDEIFDGEAVISVNNKKNTIKMVYSETETKIFTKQ